MRRGKKRGSSFAQAIPAIAWHSPLTDDDLKCSHTLLSIHSLSVLAKYRFDFADLGCSGLKCRRHLYCKGSVVMLSKRPVKCIRPVLACETSQTGADLRSRCQVHQPVDLIACRQKSMRNRIVSFFILYNVALFSRAVTVPSVAIALAVGVWNGRLLVHPPKHVLFMSVPEVLGSFVLLCTPWPALSARAGHDGKTGVAAVGPFNLIIVSYRIMPCLWQEW